MKILQTLYYPISSNKKCKEKKGDNGWCSSSGLLLDKSLECESYGNYDRPILLTQMQARKKRNG
jgi:hypothetical protein